ncbi:DUF262 domain-containing protein [Pseudoflavonifractor sp. 60]|uniref:DUF262 domain-containing protein n=1 Tax=Pseudoflavonifractor sp. 60 TaxID=2304576 RepID=UPI00136E331B|nr:DUF262 domain-containing protein [Pseudoflavonifractor sp. 60]NBI66276.1 DUF262 domain-containing protein [Pseudoflavonifractor sp. 60]
MDAHKALIQDIFNNGTLIEVPFFQRSYVWKGDLWQRLLDDMEFIVKTGKPHFFGSIILKVGRKRRQGDLFTVCKTVVDGQQRLTTFLIFMKVLCLKTGQTTMFDMQFRLMGQTLALCHGKNDIAAFEKVMASTSAEQIDDPAPGSRIIEAFNFFVKNLDETKLDIMTIMTNTQFVKIDLDEDEDEQQIFDTINSLGVNLTTSELLKNYFFSRETIQEYEAKWVSVFEKDDDVKAYWDTELETGRLKRAMIDIFFDAYFQLFIQDRNYNITNEDKLMYARVDHLSQSYQHFINTYCGGNKNVVLDAMHDYALCFMNTFKLDQCERSIPSNFGVERINVVIFGLKNTTMIPYILFVAKNISDDAEKNRIYGILESYIMRRMIVHASTKNYNNLFTSLILNQVLDADTLQAKLKNAGDATTYTPDDNELWNGFENSKLVNLQSKGIIYLIESKIRPSNSAVALLGFNQYSLEHLMPKKWRNNWTPCATDDLERQRDSILLTLGNLAIITQSLNASIRDATWDMKKAGNGNGKPGLALCASGLCTLYDVLTKVAWDENEISARAKWLFEQARTIWSL